MSRSPLLVIVAVIAIVIVGGLFVLSTQAREVPQTRVEKPVPDAVLAH